MRFFLIFAGYFGLTLAGLVFIALGIATIFGVPTPLSPEAPKNEYVVDFAASIHDPLPIVVVTTCTQQPQSDPDYRAYCDIPGRHAVVVTPEQWDAYKMGSPR